MKKYIEQIKIFYLKNRLLIIGGLGFVLLMQICSQGGKVEHSKPGKAIESISENLPGDMEVKPLQELYAEHQREQSTNPEMTSLFILMGLILLFYVATKRGWIQKIMPAIVWVSLKLKRSKVDGQRMASLTIINHTKESLTFTSLILAFGGIGTKARKFRIKSNDGQNAFPLTLMPGTSYQINVNIDRFREKAGGVSNAKWVRLEVESPSKTYNSIWKYLF